MAVMNLIQNKLVGCPLSPILSTELTFEKEQYMGPLKDHSQDQVEATKFGGLGKRIVRVDSMCRDFSHSASQSKHRLWSDTGCGLTPSFFII